MIILSFVLMIILIFEICYNQNKEVEYIGRISSLQLKIKEKEQIITNLKKDIRRLENRNLDVEI